MRRIGKFGCCLATVLYRGLDAEGRDGIRWRNGNDYLRNLRAKGSAPT